MVQTVEQLTGLKFDYWAMTGFASFEQMVDDVDGLVVDVPFAMSDEDSRAFFDPGVQRLDGDNALPSRGTGTTSPRATSAARRTRAG